MRLLLLDIILQTPKALPALVHGTFGVAKTAIIRQLSKALNAILETLIAATRQPEDFGGYGVPDEKEGLRRLGDSWVMRVKRAIADGAKKIIVFMDEASCAPPATQAAMLRPIHEGWVGDDYLDPEIVKFIAAANPPEEAAGGWDMALPLAGRWTHIDWAAPTVAETFDHLTGGPGAIHRIVKIDQDVWERMYLRACALVGSYLRRKGAEFWIEDVKKDSSRFPAAFGRPRTWENATRLLASCMTLEATADPGDADGNRVAAEIRAYGSAAKFPLIAGSVGKPGAEDFCTWMIENDLPDPEDLLKNPKSFKFTKDREDVTFAVLGMVASAAVTPQGTVKEYKKRWDAGWLVVEQALPISRGLCAVAARALAVKKNRPKGSLLDKKVAEIINELSEVLAYTGIYEDADAKS